MSVIEGEAHLPLAARWLYAQRRRPGPVGYANRAETVPRPAMFASKASPGFTGTMGPSAPESTTSPARSGRLRRASSPASQAIALSGLPRHAAPVPFETTSSRLVICICRARRSKPSRRRTGPPKYEESRGGVVGDGVDDADVPIGDPAADDLERGHRIRDGAQHVGDGRRFDVDVAIEQERHLGLDLRLQHAPGGDGLVLGDHHVGEQDAEVGPIDAELLLHGAGGQPDLASDQATSLRLPVGRVLLLDGVGGVDVELGQLRPDGRDRRAGVGRADPGGEFAVFGLLVHLKNPICLSGGIRCGGG